MGIVRNIDVRYSERPLSPHPEERFAFILREALQALGVTEARSILEVGCAAGDFAHWLTQMFPMASVQGIDLHPALVKAARTRVPHAKFSVGDLEDASTLPLQPFDVVFMNTVHSHFDDCSEWLDHLLYLVAPGGRLFLFGIFNSQDVDVMVRARYSNGSRDWLPGWSVLSRKTFQTALTRRGWVGRFVDYRPSILIPRRDDPLSAWTEMGADGEMFIRNGLSQVLQFALLDAHAASAQFETR